MFDFQKLSVYQRAKEFNNLCSKVVERNALDKNIKNQLTRAALSIVLNIAEGSGKKTKADRNSFFVISRGSLYECVSILDILNDAKLIQEEEYTRCYETANEISKMLFVMIRNLEKA
jgi:four helix bundle protein